MAVKSEFGRYPHLAFGLRYTIYVIYELSRFHSVLGFFLSLFNRIHNGNNAVQHGIKIQQVINTFSTTRIMTTESTEGHEVRFITHIGFEPLQLFQNRIMEQAGPSCSNGR